MIKTLLLALALVALPASLAAQDAPPAPLPPVGEEPSVDPPPDQLPEPAPPAAAEPGEPEDVDDPAPPARAPLIDSLSAVGWCPLLWSEEGEEGGERVVCDFGLAAPLWTWRYRETDYRVSLVGSIGERTVGVGVGWCRRRVCLGVGATALRDDAGIHTDSLAAALGGTFTFGGLR